MSNSPARTNLKNNLSFLSSAGGAPIYKTDFLLSPLVNKTD
jgi:hypothetical protein